MSNSDSDDADIPEREVCEKLCIEFAQITDTDTACAQFYLQDTQWDLEKSINAYMEEQASHGGAKEAKVTPPMEEDPEPQRIRIMSWNIDGLDSNNLRNRSKAVATKINGEKPDAVFLQEVVPQSQTILEEECPLYQLIPAGGEGYFTAIMLKLSTATYADHAITPFYTSKMARNLLQVKAEIKNVPFVLMTSHLESTKAHAAERKRQLSKAFDDMNEVEEQRTVLFGGDLNLRDEEVRGIGGVPAGIVDLWEETGRRPLAQYTWDMSKNDNLEWAFPRKPRCRFDRLYLRHPTKAEKERVKPVYFELLGLERLPSCGRFCSDHWGILAHFNKLSH